MPALKWREIDPKTIAVSADSGQGVASVRLQFDDNGDICSMEADARGRAVGKEIVPTPWRGEFSDYKRFDRYRIPSRRKVSWMLDEGLFTYWEGEIVDYTVK